MGICSSQSQNNARIRKDDNGNATLLANSPPPTSTIKIVAQDGTLQEFSRSIKAAQALNNLVVTASRCFLYSAESMLVGEPPPRLSPEDQLEPGQIYFILPMSQSKYPLSLQDFCLLAIRASVALSQPRLPEKELSFAGERGGLVLCF